MRRKGKPFVVNSEPDEIADLLGMKQALPEIPEQIKKEVEKRFKRDIEAWEIHDATLLLTEGNKRAADRAFQDHKSGDSDERDDERTEEAREEGTDPAVRNGERDG